MISQRDHEFLFEILLDDDAKGLTVIQAAPIHSCDDLRRARTELARLRSAPASASPKSPL